MNSTRIMVLAFVAFVLGVLALNSFFIVDQTEQALVLRFGKPVSIIRDPGLKFKAPMLDSVVMYDKRIITLNAEPKTVILKDQDRLIVDAFVTYRITNPLLFYQTVRVEQRMNDRLDTILERGLRGALGQENLNTLLSPKRASIMRKIRDNVYRRASGQDETAEAGKGADRKEGLEAKGGFGIEVVDVRISRTDLPKETATPIYNRMRSDRQKVAEKYRAEGQRESQIIRSEADKTRTIMLAEAEKKSTIIRGEGDGEATKIFAQAFGKDKEFFAFYRSMQAYRKSLGKEDTTLILSPDNDFLRYLKTTR